MPKTDMIANTAFTYKTRRLVAEDPFEADDKWVRGLIAVKRARKAVPDPVVPRRNYEATRTEGVSIFEISEAKRLLQEKSDATAEETLDLGLKMAPVQDPPVVPSTPTKVAAPVIEDDTDDADADDDADDENASIKATRDEYAELFGKKPFMGWTEEQLREKIAAKTAADHKAGLEF